MSNYFYALWKSLPFLEKVPLINTLTFIEHHSTRTCYR